MTPPPTNTKKKNKSPSSKNYPPPDQSITLPSPLKNTPLPKQRKSPSRQKNAPPPDQKENSTSTTKELKSPPKQFHPHPQLMTKKKKNLKISGKPHLKFRSTLMTYSCEQWLYPAKCLCSIWRKSDETKRKEWCLSLSRTNDLGRLLSPPKSWFYVSYPAWA